MTKSTSSANAWARIRPTIWTAPSCAANLTGGIASIWTKASTSASPGCVRTSKRSRRNLPTTMFTERNAVSKLEEIRDRSRLLRARIIETSHKTNTPHLGSCLSCVDILAALYFSVLRIDPADPRAVTRDRFILSKGHGAAALFQVLAMRGFYPDAMLDDYGKDGGVFAEHPPTPDHLPGIEAATGSLGHGLPLGLGMAMAGRIQGRDYKVYALLSDGECNEGSIWESAMLAAAQRGAN